tara:strand:- start:835 stop:1773 length:939 start_codon:yes stop_codon:yes gene_type:complete
MSKFASGKNAKAISDRSGFQYPYRLMRREWNGLLVGPDEFEPKHPQLGPFRKVSDPQALVDSRPEQDLDSQRSTQYGFNPVGFKTLEGLAEDNDLVATGQVGTVTIFFPETLGTQATGQVGNVTVILPASVTVAISGFASMSGSVGSVSVEEGIVVAATGSSSTGSVGSVTVSIANVIAAPTGIAATSSVGSVTTVTNVTNYAVTVATGTNAYGTGNKYYIDGSVSPTLTLNEGETYWFDQSDSSNSGHPLRFSTTANGTHGGGVPYTTGVTTTGTPGSAGAYTKITVASGAPTLYYYCTNHSGMGGQANTP